MSKIGAFFKVIGSWIVANKAKSIIIGSAAAVVIGGAATGIAIATRHEHTPSSAIIENEVSASCTSSGSYDEVIYCSSCDEEIERKTVTVDALGHTEVVDAAVAPTCTQTGLTEGKHCSVCNTITVGQNIVDALGHTAVTDEAVAPDCTNAGLTEGNHCSVCNEVLVAQTVVDALGHNEISHVAKAPTCTEIGWDAYITCSRCDYTTYVEKAALTHNEISHEAKAPTCTEIGWDAYVTCSRCDYSTYAEKPALTHDEINHEAKAPTCTEIGWDAYITCSRCDYTTYVEKAALTHDEIKHDAKAPTCTEIGWDAYVTCSRCDYTTYVEKAALTHDEISHEAKAPTCTEIGWNAYVTCSRCDYTTYAEKPALEHDLKHTGAKAPTCTEIGWDAYVTCSRCDYTTYASIEETGHSHNAVVTKPTCTEKGYTTHTCHCGDTYVGTYVDALGHKDENTDGYCDTCDVIVDIKLAISGTYYSIYREKIVVDTEYFKLDDEEYIVVFTYEISSDVFTATYHSVICDDAELKELIEKYYEGAVFSYGFAFTKETISLIDEDLDAEVYYRPEFLPPCEHDVITVPGKAPTCTEEGYTDHVYCDICGEVFTELESIEKIDHTYDQTVASDDYLKSEATVDSPAIYYKSCICGAKGGKTFTHGDVLTIPLSSVTLNKTEVTLAVGATETLIATLNPSNTTEKTKWVSSDESVVKVVDGSLIAVGRGNAIVTVETEDYIFAYCTVKVIIPVENVTLDKSEAEIYVGQPFALNAIVLPENADGKTLTWTSSDETVATVNANGVVTAKSAGTVIITATAPNGVSASCALTVKAGELKFTATEDSSFYYVSGYEGYETHIEIPNMHDGLRVIRVAESAFKGNTIIESITLPNSIQTIDAHAFEGCTSLKTITIPDSVTVINAYTFADCTALTSILLNKNLTSIGEYAFKGCTAITDISIKAAGAKLATIGNYAFANCTALKSFDISEYASVLETVGDHAFSRCTALESVILSNSVKTISTSAFEYCSALTSIDLGESLVTIADKAFDYCISLTKIEMPDTVTTLGNMAFRHNDELSEVIFSSSLVKIGNAAFQYCISIEELVLPENITQFGNSAFSYCEGIKYLGILGNITVWGDSTFYECGNIEVIYIASKTNSEIPENNYIFYNAGAKSEGIALALGINAVIPEGLFEPVEDIENYPRIAGIMAENGSVSFNAFAEKNNLPYLIAISMPDSMESLTYGIFNNSPWWEAQEKGVVYIDNYFYGYKCECHAATPTEIWVENYLAPTCTEEGFYQNVCKCSVCEYEVLRQDVIIPELGHAPLDAVVENYVAPDCITDGSYDSVIYCGRCGDELSRTTKTLTKLGHTAEAAVEENRVEAACTEDGHYDSVVYCKTCNAELSRTTKTITKLGHTAKEAVEENRVDATCTEDGHYDSVVYCKRCNHEMSRSKIIIPQANNLHSIVDDVCNYCGRRNSSAGLKYTLNSDGKGYTVTGKGTFSGSSLVIDLYNNLPVTSIGSSAFYYCDSLTSVTIGNNVTSIGSYAFSGCYKLVEVINHSSLNITAGNSSNGYVGAYAKEVHKGESKIVNYNDYLFYTYNGVNYLLGYVGNDKDLVLPESYKGENYEIYEYTFYERNDITSVVISNGVTIIGNLAFEDCDSLTSVTILGGVTSIGSSAFSGCSSLESMTLPFVGGSKSATSASSSTLFGYIFGTSSYAGGVSTNQYYSYNSYLTYYIPSSLKSVTITGGNILYGAFSYCTSLTSITIPDSVTSIGNYAFEYCRSLTSVTIGNSVTSIGYNAFYNCTSLTSVTIPDSVTNIGDYAFENCTRLTNVTIPDSVTSIGWYAFDGCTNLIQKENGVCYVDKWIVACDTSVTSVTLRKNTIGIANSALADFASASLTSITVSNENTTYKSVDGKLYSKDGKTLIRYAGGKEDTSFTIPNSVTSIGFAAFADCDSLTSVTIPDSVTSIGNCAFEDCTSLTSVTIGNSVTSIGNYAFNRCTSLTSVTIGNSVTSIGEQAFCDCTSLTSVTIGDSVTSIGDDAFRDCDSLTSVYITDIAKWCGISFGSSDSNPLYYAHNLYLNGDLMTELEIPDSVTSIGASAFAYCTSLTSVTIPDGVTSIGSDAFSGCSKLTYNEYGNAYYLGNSTNPYIYLVKAKNTSITSCDIYNGTLFIGSDAFSACSKLTSVTIPDSVTSIGEQAFRSCTSLTSITIPNSVTSIGNYAFNNCTSLTSITIPDSVTSICSSAFSGCTSLTSVVIGNGVTSIGSYAFEDCTSLTSIKYRGTSSQWSSITKGNYWDQYYSNGHYHKINYTMTYNYKGA